MGEGGRVLRIDAFAEAEVSAETGGREVFGGAPDRTGAGLCSLDARDFGLTAAAGFSTALSSVALSLTLVESAFSAVARIAFVLIGFFAIVRYLSIRFNIARSRVCLKLEHDPSQGRQGGHQGMGPFIPGLVLGYECELPVAHAATGVFVRI